MSAHVLLNLLNDLGKKDKMRGLPSILSFFAKSLINSIKQEHEFKILFIIWQILRNLISGVKTLSFCHDVHNVVMDVIAFHVNL